MTRVRGFFIILLAVFAAVLLPAALWADPPSRAGRLNLVEGSVSFRPAASQEWAPATLNYPLTTGDQLWTDAGGRAEAHLGQAAVRLAPETDVSVQLLDDQTVQLQLSQGSLNVRLRALEPDEIFEVATPDATISLTQPGSYRIDVEQSTDLIVRSGEAELTTEASSVRVSPNQYAVVADPVSGSFQFRVAPALDDWDQWCIARDRNEDRYASSRHVSHAVVGYEDLDQYGSWVTVPEYGECWQPRVAVAGWAPYRFGHWAWVDPWGWSWIDDQPWGFAPFHYGRWAFVSGSWFWVPGAIGLRPVYAPALVVFFGGAGWAVAMGEGVGWCPLGPQEVYVPPYRVSRTYIYNVNVAHARRDDIDRWDPDHHRYRNRDVAGAVTVVPRQAFVRAQPVSRAAIAVGQADIGRAPVVKAGPPVAPERESILGRPLGANQAVARPPESVRNRRAFAPQSGAVEQKRAAVQQQPRATAEEKRRAAAEDQRRAAVQEQQRQATVEEQRRAAAEDQKRAAVEQQRRATVEEQRRAAAEDQRRAAIEQQRRAEQERNGPAVQSEPRRGEQPRYKAPKKQRKLIHGPHGWEWVWVEDNGGN